MRSRCLLISMVALFVVGVLVEMSYADIDPETVVAFWSFDDGAGNTATDSSKNSLDGELVGDPKWVNGKVDKALEFNGMDDYVEVSDITTPPLLTF